MKSKEIINNLDGILRDHKNKVGNISQFIGGWEGWLQVELALTFNLGSVLREQYLWEPKPDNHRIDMWFPDDKFGVELKCLGLNQVSPKSNHFFSDGNAQYDNFAKRSNEDVEKLEKLPPDFKWLAVAIVPRWVPEDKEKYLVGKLLDASQGGKFSEVRLLGNGGFLVFSHCRPG